MRLLLGGSPCTFPDTIQLGDAYQVREDGWSLPRMIFEKSAGPRRKRTDGAAEAVWVQERMF